MQTTPTTPPPFDLVIPEFQKFGNELYEKLYFTLNGLLWEKHTIILNMIDRSTKESARKKDLIYAGIDKQRELLKDNNRWLNKYWNILRNNHINQYDGVTSPTIFKKFKNGDLSLSDIQISSLKEYFSVLENDLQRAEHPILDEFFNIAMDKFIAVPVIRFGYIDGIAYIIFKSYEKNLFKEAIIKNKKYARFVKEDSPEWDENTPIRGNILTQIITSFSRKYEELLFEWVRMDIDDDNFYQYIDYIKFLDKDLMPLISHQTYFDNVKTVILKELAYPDYYEGAKKAIQKKIYRVNQFAKQYTDQYRKTATIATMIDSYAHNISAHSLTTLNWMFNERAELYKEFKEEVKKPDYIFSEFFEQYENQNTIELNPISKYKGPLAFELTPLFKLLLEKGSLWSGLIRSKSFGGKVSSFYKILWYDFINNPLYLGTIAYSEKIRKIHINLTIFEEEIRVEGDTLSEIKNRKKIKCINGRKLDGTLAIIDMENPREENNSLENNSLENKYLELKKQSLFVKLGNKFELFRKELLDYRTFFPGGVVGKHAFFTLIENEIRNVKHYEQECLQEIQENGLIVNISIHERHIANNEVPKETDKDVPKELYKIGVWLKHPVKPISKELAQERFDRLDGDIITKNFEPKLGGTYQDKICAAMLLNNDFNSVHRQETERDKIYYPWLKTAISEAESNDESVFIHDWEISLRKYIEYKEKFILEYKPVNGYLKKYFHIWKGADIYHVNNNNQLSGSENIARFKFVTYDNKDYETYLGIRKSGVIRIIEDIENKNIVSAYQKWLIKWRKNDLPFAIDIIENAKKGEDPDNKIVYLNDELTFLSTDDIDDSDDATYDNYKSLKTHSIPIVHAGKKNSKVKCTYKKHGSLMKNFYTGAGNINATTIRSSQKLYELFEMLITKVAIFDNRLAQRIPNEEKRKLYHNTLNCSFFEETKQNWNEVKDNLLDYHFLVIHLSFIESETFRNGKKYNESEINKFIEKEILQGENIKEVGDNFIIVITTGRGRTEWWNKVSNSEYAKITTFRPIESLIAGVENALQIKDDFDLKYNLVRVLFGS